MNAQFQTHKCDLKFSPMTHIRILRACKGIENWRIDKEKVLWIFAAVLITIISHNDDIIESYYSNGIYPIISKILRLITGVLPFSVGDLGYIIVSVYCLIRFFFYMSKLTKASPKPLLINGFSTFVLLLLKLYVVFMLCWGLNYSRAGIEKRLDLKVKNYDTASITMITNELIDSVNILRKKISPHILPIYSRSDIIKEAVESYRILENANPLFSYSNTAIKETFFASVSNYLGFLGYYNPFSGEAQLRMDIPNVLIPFVTCHEIAHQIGNAGEDQANFIGYLAGKSSKDAYFRYSTYLELLNYALSEQYNLYSVTGNFKRFEHIVKQNRSRMDTLVKLDRKLIRQFFDKRRNKIAPVVSTLYDQYLRLNKQNAGLGSYDLVVKWLIAYKEKNGKI
jgi:hypothetical protein